MDEYVDRKKFENVLKIADSIAKANGKDKDRQIWDRAIRLLNDMPTADVASVVRCKDCSWHQSVDDDGDDFEVCNYYNREVMGYQFCSEAEPYKTPEEKAEFRRSVGLDEGVAMAEYINRKALLKKAWDADTRIGYVQVVDVGDILDMPVADVAPVVHAHWVVRFDGPYKRRRCYCSYCGKHNGVGGIAQNQEKPYCPNCGAKMNEKETVYD
nr:MAG TPA: DNA-directed RNA polymerase [Caudoviricetes sp.]